MLWNILDMLVDSIASAFLALFGIALIMLGALAEWPIMVIVGIVFIIIGAIVIAESIYFCVKACQYDKESLLEKEAA